MPLAYQDNPVLENGDFAVRHLLLKGTNFEIGKKLGTVAQEHHGIQRNDSADPFQTRCQRKYMEKNYPIFYERMLGIAAAYEADLNEDRYDFSVLGTLNHGPGCSAVYFPPGITTSGHGILSRNLDFFPSMLSKLYILELYPEQGYPSLSFLSFELLGESLEGINSEGLVVIHLADDESGTKYSMEPTVDHAVGFNELKVIQFLLDTCADVNEAKEALLTNKHFYMFQPIHLLIADKYGSSFVWEYSHAHNKEYVIDGNGQPQIVTNFLLHRYNSVSDLPSVSQDKGCPYNRYRTLHNSVEKARSFTPEVIRDINAQVFMDQTAFSPSLPVRTILHSIYNCNNRSVQASFYLGDNPNQSKTGSLRTEYFTFSLSRS